jgi:hypothetical protein
MKTGLANKTYQPPRTAFGRTRSVDKSAKEDLAFTESLSPYPQNHEIGREVNHLEHKLDKAEISLRNSFPRDKISREQEIRCYFEFLNGIAGVVKKKDQKLSKSLFRGLIALEKCLEKIVSGFRKDLKNLVVHKPNVSDFFTQTEEEPKKEKMDNELLPELENIKKLAEGLKKIKLSRIAGQLFELYESLSKMQTDIPEPTLMPDREIENTSPDMIMSMHLNVIKNHVFHILTGSKPEPSEKPVDKETQCETPPKPPELKILEKTVFEKEKELLKTKERAEKSSIQHKVLEEKMKSMEKYYKEIEKKQNETEIESARFRGRFQHSEVVIVAQEKRIQWFDGKLLKKTEKLVQAKLRIDELKKIIVKKQKVMNKLQDELFDTKISWKVCEEKLFDIQKAWEHKTGRQFQHKEVDLEIIIAKHAIAKEDLSDKNEEMIINERESSVSENEPPDAEEFQEIINQKNFDFPVLDKKDFKKNNFETFWESKKDMVLENSKKDVFLENSKKDPGIENKNQQTSEKKRKITKKIIESFVSDPPESSQESEDSSEILQNPNLSHKKPFKKSSKKGKILRKGKETETGDIFESQVSWIEDSESFEPDSILSFAGVSLKNPVQKSYPAQTSFNPSHLNQSLQDPLQSPPKKSFFTNSSNFSPSSESNTKVSLKFNSGQVSYSFKSRETRSKPFESKVKELQHLEKKLTKDFNKKEQEFIKSLINDQPDLFSQYKNLKEKLENIRKELNIYVLSTGVQCSLIENVPELKKNIQGQLGLSDFANSARNPFEELREEDEKELLARVFENEKGIFGLSLKDKALIVKSVKGHKKEQCREMCPHLLRVLKIKWRCRGTLYPVRNILMKSEDINAN